MTRCFSFSSSSAGKAGCRISSLSVRRISPRSLLSDCPLIETVKVFEERLWRAPADSSSSAISSLPRVAVPLLSIVAVKLPNPSFPGGLKISPARKVPETETVGLAWFSRTSSRVPFDNV